MKERFCSLRKIKDRIDCRMLQGDKRRATLTSLKFEWELEWNVKYKCARSDGGLGMLGGALCTMEVRGNLGT